MKVLLKMSILNIHMSVEFFLEFMHAIKTTIYAVTDCDCIHNWLYLKCVHGALHLFLWFVSA